MKGQMKVGLMVVLSEMILVVVMVDRWAVDLADYLELVKVAQRVE